MLKLIEAEEYEQGGHKVSVPNPLLVHEDEGNVKFTTSGYGPDWNLFEEEDYKEQMIHLPTISLLFALEMSYNFIIYF